MKEIQITTFVWDKKSVDIALSKNILSLLLEHPYYSLRSMQEDRSANDFTTLESLIDWIQLQNAEAKIIFNLDLLAHNEDLPAIEKLLLFLKAKKISGIRVQEIGLAHLARRILPSVEIQFSPEVGLNNDFALSFLHTTLLGGMDLFVAPNELPYREMERMHRTTGIPLEIHAQGKILLQYSGRRVLSGSGLTPHSLKAYEEKRKEDGRHTFLENEHGTFMYHLQDRCLLSCIPQIYEAKASSILIDCRGEALDYFEKVLTLYKTELEAYAAQPESYSYDPDREKELLAMGHGPYTLGFFFENLTDKNVDKTLDPSTQEPGAYIGSVLDSIKENVMAIETKHSFQKGDTLLFINPGGKEVKVRVNKVMNYKLDEIEKAEEKRINVIGWHKGIISRASVYKIDSE